MAPYAAHAGSVRIVLALVLAAAAAVAEDAVAQARPPASLEPDPGAEGDSAPNVPELRRTDERPGIRVRARPEAAPASPAPIRRADDTVVVCSILLQAEAAAVLDGAALTPGTARISGDGEAVEVVWSGARIEGVEGQKRASCRAENQQITSIVLDGEELLAGPQPY